MCVWVCSNQIYLPLKIRSKVDRKGYSMIWFGDSSGECGKNVADMSKKIQQPSGCERPP